METEVSIEAFIFQSNPNFSHGHLFANPIFGTRGDCFGYNIIVGETYLDKGLLVIR